MKKTSKKNGLLFKMTGKPKHKSNKEEQHKMKMTKILFCFGILLFLFAFFSHPLIGSDGMESRIFLAGGKLFDGKGEVIEKSLVCITGNTIVYAGPEKKIEVEKGSMVIDCSGKTVLPGLFDAHIHLGGACTYGYILVGDERKLAGFLYSGVTSVFDLGGITDWIFGLKDKEKKGNTLSPHIFCVGPLFTCPKGHGTEYGVPMALTPTTEVEAREKVRELAKNDPDQIKIIYRQGSEGYPSLSYELMETIIDESHKLGFKVVTHIETVKQAWEAILAGSDGLAHMPADKEVDEDLLQVMKENNVFCMPTLSVYESFSTPLIPESRFLEWPLLEQSVCREFIEDLKEKARLENIKNIMLSHQGLLSTASKNCSKMAEAGIMLVLGTDAGNPAVFFGPSVHREMELMVQAGLEPEFVLTAATKNAAEVLGKGKELGTIEKGKRADILLVDGDPLKNIRDTQKVCLVIKDGLLLDREKLAVRINPPREKETAPEPQRRKTGQSSSGPVSKESPELAEKTAQARELLRRGYSTWDSSLMEKARDMFLALLLKVGEHSFYLHYYTAFCDYRLANYYLINGDMKTCARFNDEAKKYLEKAMELDDMSGESHALYATCLGYDIALDPSLGMTAGMESATHFNKAFQKEPESPRVNLLQGISLLYTPEMYGGGLDKAMPLLEKAVSLYEEKTDKGLLQPDWGHEDALTFLGMAYARKGENDKAEQSFKKALEVNPEYGLAAEELKKLKK
ncbi:MAG: amidohydrolase family protein [Candidatus Aminicenantes bacterium]|nr:amidohydrolase family protein [Candidatus Aminicenantes bacterium]